MLQAVSGALPVAETTTANRLKSAKGGPPIKKGVQEDNSNSGRRVLQNFPSDNAGPVSHGTTTFVVRANLAKRSVLRGIPYYNRVLWDIGAIEFIQPHVQDSLSLLS